MELKYRGDDNAPGNFRKRYYSLYTPSAFYKEYGKPMTFVLWLPEGLLSIIYSGVELWL